MKRDKAEPLTDLLIDYRQLLLLLRVCYKQKALSTGRYAKQVQATMNSYFGMLQHYDAHRLTTCIISQLPRGWFQWMYIVRRGHRCKMVVKPTL